jgi:hypothetical protein
MLNRFVGVRDAGHGRARSTTTSTVSTVRSPPAHEAVASERGALAESKIARI